MKVQPKDPDARSGMERISKFISEKGIDAANIKKERKDQSSSQLKNKEQSESITEENSTTHRRDRGKSQLVNILFFHLFSHQRIFSDNLFWF